MAKQKKKRQENGYRNGKAAGFIQIAMLTGTFTDLFRGIWIFQQRIGFQISKMQFPNRINESMKFL